MLNFVSGRYTEPAPWHDYLLRLMRWAQTTGFGRWATRVNTRRHHKPPQGMDADTQLMLTLARQQMTNLTK
jgi:hypothetical protein